MKRVNAVRSMLTGLVLATAACGAAREEDAPITWEQYWAKQVVQVNDESSPMNGLFIVEGDMTFESVADVRAYFDAYIASAPPPSSNPDIGETGDYLKQAVANNQPVRWSASAAQNLTYCVDNKAPHYTQIVHAMDIAAHDWENYGNFNLIHQSIHDGNCNNVNNRAILFRVVEDHRPPFVAAAFFPPPIDGHADRWLVVNYPAVPPEDTLPGVLRHELGHVFGFVHEHTNTRLCGETGPVRPLTPFDRKSVMMYRGCGGQMDRGMPLTQFDKRGVCTAYPGRGACAAL